MSSSEPRDLSGAVCVVLSGIGVPRIAVSRHEKRQPAIIANTHPVGKFTARHRGKRQQRRFFVHRAQIHLAPIRSRWLRDRAPRMLSGPERTDFDSNGGGVYLISRTTQSRREA